MSSNNCLSQLLCGASSFVGENVVQCKSKFYAVFYSIHKIGIHKILGEKKNIGEKK